MKNFFIVIITFLCTFVCVSLAFSWLMKSRTHHHHKAQQPSHIQEYCQRTHSDSGMDTFLWWYILTTTLTNGQMNYYYASSPVNTRDYRSLPFTYGGSGTSIPPGVASKISPATKVDEEEIQEPEQVEEHDETMEATETTTESPSESSPSSPSTEGASTGGAESSSSSSSGDSGGAGGGDGGGGGGGGD
jgi:uncharacterized membrane protein YgcG